MTHPAAEELTEFLYEELTLTRQQEVAKHLEVCGKCRDRVTGWQNARQDLAGWQLPSPFRSMQKQRTSWTLVKQGVAAALFLGGGFWLAKATSQSPDSSQLRAELRLEIRSELEQRLTAEMAAYASRDAHEREQLQRSIADAMGKLEARHGAEQTALRQDVETVALRTQEEFDRIEQSAATPSAPSNP